MKHNYKRPSVRGALFFIKICITLFFAAVAVAQEEPALLFEQNEAAEPYEIWSEQEHPQANYLSLFIGADVHRSSPGGYGNTELSDVLNMYSFGLYASKKIPLLSRLSINSTSDIELSPDIVTASTDSSYMEMFAELRLPFTTNFLSHKTSWYLMYKYAAAVYANADADFQYDGNLYDNERYGIGSHLHFIALAVDTPVTYNDSPDSLSRFGIFYQFEERIREASISALAINNELIGIDEHRIGAFYDIIKPVFVDDLIVRLNLQLAFGYRVIHANALGLSKNDFSDYTSIFMIDADIEVAYRFRLGENGGLRMFAGFNFGTILALSSKEDFNNGENQDIRGGIKLDYMF